MRFKITIFTALFLAVFQFKASACYCNRVSVKDGIAKVDHVFLAKVIKVEKIGNEYVTQVNILKHFKRKTTLKTAKIITMIDSSICGYVFRTGKEYVIYAYKTTRKNELYTDSCTRTTASVKEETEGIMALNAKK